MSGIGYVVKHMTVSIKRGASAGVDYECAITGVQEGETSDTVTSQTACADGAITDVGPSAWTLTIGYNVSNLPTSLHRVLRDHAGEDATVSIEPFPVQEPGYRIEYDVVLKPGAADYTVGAYGAASVQLPVNGKPRTVDPVAPQNVTTAAPADASAGATT